MNKDGLKLLLEKHFSNTINSRECKKLLSYLSKADADIILTMLDEILDNGKTNYVPAFDNLRAAAVFEKIKADPRMRR